MNSDFNSVISNSSIQEIHIDIQEIEQNESSPNDVCDDCNNQDTSELYIKKGIFDILKKNKLELAPFQGVDKKKTLGSFNSLQRNSTHSLHFDDCGSSGDDNYFGEHTSDLSDTYSEDQDSFVGENNHLIKNNGSHRKITYKKLNYHQVERSIDKYYSDINHKYSSALDILASYLKGHKIIYMEAKSYSEEKLNGLMILSDFIIYCRHCFGLCCTIL